MRSLLSVAFTLFSLAGLLGTVAVTWFSFRLWRRTGVLGFGLVSGASAATLLATALMLFPRIGALVFLASMSWFGVALQLVGTSFYGIVGAIAWYSIHKAYAAQAPNAAQTAAPTLGELMARNPRSN